MYLLPLILYLSNFTVFTVLYLLFFCSLEKVVQTVAVFKKPPAGTAGRATYELKPQFYDEYDVFYYHYNKDSEWANQESDLNRESHCGPFWEKQGDSSGQ